MSAAWPRLRAIALAYKTCPHSLFAHRGLSNRIWYIASPSPAQFCTERAAVIVFIPYLSIMLGSCNEPPFHHIPKVAIANIASHHLLVIDFFLPSFTRCVCCIGHSWPFLVLKLYFPSVPHTSWPGLKDSRFS